MGRTRRKTLKARGTARAAANAPIATEFTRQRYSREKGCLQILSPRQIDLICRKSSENDRRSAAPPKNYSWLLGPIAAWPLGEAKCLDARALRDAPWTHMGVRVAHFKHGLEDYLVLSYPISRPGCFAKLTRAELDVAERVIAGATVRDIARERGVSEPTASNQLGQIYAKLEIHSRHELLAIVSGTPTFLREQVSPLASVSRPPASTR